MTAKRYTVNPAVLSEGKAIDGPRETVVMAADYAAAEKRAETAEAERDAAMREREQGRLTIARLNRRCQLAESVADQNVEACRKQGVSFGRALGIYAASKAEAECARLRERIAALRGYTIHGTPCAYWDKSPSSRPCTCGLDELLR